MSGVLIRVLGIGERAVEIVSQKVHSLGGIILAVMMLLTAVDVFGRYLFNSPIDGSIELNELALVVMIFLGLALTASHKGHVRVEVLISVFPQRLQIVMESLCELISAVLFFLMTWQAYLLVLAQHERNLTTTVLFIPVYPFAFVLVVGGALVFLVLLSQCIQDARRALQTEGKAWEWFVPLVVTAAVVIGGGLWLPGAIEDFSSVTIGVGSMAMMLALMFIGVPIGFAMAWIGFLGMFLLVSPDAGLTILRTVPYATASNYSLSVVPLFILMGAFAFHTGLSRDLYFMAYRWLGHLPGGLAMATVGGCAGFAAVSGSSLATAATMGMVALPEMKKYKYKSSLATGCIAAGGSIGILIPPSVVLVIYGILTRQPIGTLFVAGFIPGIMEAVFYIITIYILCKRNPAIGPPGEKSSFNLRMRSFKETWGAVVLFVVVIGGLYVGAFTPTEAAGIGAFGALVFTILRKQLNLSNFFSSLNDSAKTSAMAFAILIGAMCLGYFLTVSQLPFDLAEFVAGLQINRYLILLLILLIYMALGCVMDSLSIIILTVPIFYPLITALEFDPIWFGIIMVRVVEVGMITPPVGINVFIIKGVAPDVPMYTIFKGIVPFLIADLVQVALLILAPEIVLILPQLMGM